MSARILSVTGTPHPKALVESVNAESGTVFFQWLAADGTPRGSGGQYSFFPPAFTMVDGVKVWDDPDDVDLIEAIEHQPATSAPVVRLTPLEVLRRLTQAEEIALTTSADLSVAIVRQRFIAATYIDTSDPLTAEGIAVLVTKGILTQARADEIFS